jgi:hypothetical protein
LGLAGNGQWPDGLVFVISRSCCFRTRRFRLGGHRLLVVQKAIAAFGVGDPGYSACWAGTVTVTACSASTGTIDTDLRVIVTATG